MPIERKHVIGSFDLSQVTAASGADVTHRLSGVCQADRGDGRRNTGHHQGRTLDAVQALIGQTLNATQADRSTPAVLAAGRPRADHGVAVAALRFKSGIHLAGHCRDHLITFMMSAPARLNCSIAGRRLEHHAGAGSLSICPSNTDCGAEGANDADALSLVISAESLAMEALEAGTAEPHVIERLHGRDDGLLKLAETLLAESSAGLPNGALFWSSVTDQILQHVATHHISIPPKPAVGSMGRHVLAKLTDYIHAHMDEPIGLPELAALAGCSRFHFTRLFRRATGLTPHRYVMRLRLKQAMQLLRSTALPLTEVAAATGFTDQSHLSRWMRHAHGFTPGELRGGSLSAETSSGL